jgi:hypothetical protein
VTDAIVEAVVRLDDPTLPLAEVARRVAADAERQGLTRPSYERLRQVIKEQRMLRASLGPSAWQLYLDSGMWVTQRFVDELKKPRDERHRLR